jgi:nitroreductase
MEEYQIQGYSLYMNFLSQLNWRFATNDFDPDFTVSDENLNQILDAIQMTPSSYGLQPYHVVVIKNKELRSKLLEHGFNQPAIIDASHLLVFCTRTDALERIDQYVELASNGDKEKAEKLQGYANIMRQTVSAKSPEALKSWADRQTYIALGFAMAACAELELDSAPMEGFKPDTFDEHLELPASMKSVVLLAIGKRAHDSKRAKVRFSKEDLFSPTFLD